MSVSPIYELKRGYILYLHPVMLLRFVSVREFTRGQMYMYITMKIGYIACIIQLLTIEALDMM